MWKWPCLLWSPLRVASSKHIRWERWCRRYWTVINAINIIFAVPLTYLELYLPIYFKTYLMCKAIQDRAESSKLGLLMRWFKILNKIFLTQIRLKSLFRELLVQSKSVPRLVQVRIGQLLIQVNINFYAKLYLSLSAFPYDAFYWMCL